MNPIRCILFAVYLLSTGMTYAETDDPVNDFLALRASDVKDDEALMVIRVDLNADGTPEVFLSREKDTNGRLGNIWMVYMSRGNKFLRCDNLVTLNHESLILKKLKSTCQSRLFSVTSPQKGQLLLMEFLALKTAIVSKKIAKIELLSEEDGSDAVIDLLKNANQNMRPLTKGKVQDLKKSMSAQPNRK